MKTPQPGCSCVNITFLLCALAGVAVGWWLVGLWGAVLGFPAGFLIALVGVWIVGGLAFLADRRSKPKP